ncbi:hypothetical protein A1122_04765 [Yersinia pestis A1122]|uniref:Uncharacterized protein n=1 Tax=Yersinia pestis TaxID=632 RepID=Q8CLW4_YERPE|nr:hypothetical [Yersinia pestis KIM10+]AEL71622.1 hypothetical protein A1122_04765 [Yersinia pestis A1122]EKS47834.1 hypothetical protein INS_00385 [Yersinia pestis INS]
MKQEVKANASGKLFNMDYGKFGETQRNVKPDLPHG